MASTRVLNGEEWESLLLRLVDETSGGIKMTSLVVLVIEYCHLHNVDVALETLPELLEGVIRRSSTMKILEYTWRDLNRQKLFVYTP